MNKCSILKNDKLEGSCEKMSNLELRQSEG